jgi:diguanylate cyclase
MDEKKSIAEIQELFRLALPLMTKHNVPITPKNYMVWYDYTSGADEKLTKAINSMLEEGREFTEETNEALYGQFCAETDENELKAFRENLRQILFAVLKQVADFTGQTEGYESSIANQVRILAENPSADEVKRVIRALMGETETIGKFVKTIRGELKETTEALDALKLRFEQVKTEALVDFLTGLPNRKAFSEALAAGVAETESDDKAPCLLFIDIDHFAEFNNNFGHLVGDEVLKFVAKKIKEMVRGNDYAARFGGEEFAVILPRTPLPGAQTVAETIRSFFAKTRLQVVPTSKTLGTVTVSIGVACYRKGEPLEQFVERSDQALYLAKKAGRNRVATESDLPDDQKGSGRTRSRGAANRSTSPGPSKEHKKPADN